MSYIDVKQKVDFVRTQVVESANTAQVVGEAMQAVLDYADSLTREIAELRQALKDVTAVATQQKAGLMSAADKRKLDGIESGAQRHIPVTPSEGKQALSAEIAKLTTIEADMRAISMEIVPTDSGVKFCIKTSNETIGTEAELPAIDFDNPQQRFGVISVTDRVNIRDFTMRAVNGEDSTAPSALKQRVDALQTKTDNLDSYVKGTNIKAKLDSFATRVEKSQIFKAMTNIDQGMPIL